MTTREIERKEENERKHDKKKKKKKENNIDMKHKTEFLSGKFLSKFFPFF